MLRSGRGWWPPPPYGQPDCKISVFFLTTSLTTLEIYLNGQEGSVIPSLIQQSACIKDGTHCSRLVWTAIQQFSTVESCNGETEIIIFHFWQKTWLAWIFGLGQLCSNMMKYIWRGPADRGRNEQREILRLNQINRLSGAFSCPVQRKLFCNCRFVTIWWLSMPWHGWQAARIFHKYKKLKICSEYMSNMAEIMSWSN